MGTLYGGAGDKAEVIGTPLDFDLNQKLRSAKEVFLATAFARLSGWKLIKDALIESNAAIKIVTGLYCCHTEPALLKEWLKIKRTGWSVKLAILQVFHPKVLIVCCDDCRFAVVGSGNLTGGGLTSNVECSIYTDASAHVDSLLMWFDEIKCKKLEEDDINKYEPLCRQSEAAQKVIEAAQQAAEEAITSAIVFRKRSEAIGAAKAYFNSPIFAAKKAQLSAIIPEIRKWLDYPTFHFDLAAWTQFYKKAGLGAIRPAYLPPTDPDSSERYVGEIRAALHFLFEKEDGLEERISQLLEDTDRHVTWYWDQSGLEVHGRSRSKDMVRVQQAVKRCSEDGIWI
jgi:HKD family nuclease